VPSSGQNKQACYSNDLKGFIKDGQDYTLTLENSKTGKIFLTFFEGFQYRLVICSSNTKDFKISLYDIDKKLLYSTVCNDFIKNIDIQFNSNIACIAEVSVDNIAKENPKFTIAIAFKQTPSAK
jgi:hypothetical protein